MELDGPGQPVPIADPAHDLGGRSVRSGAVRLSGQAIQVILGIGGGAVLARILTPSDFGIFAMAISLVAFIGWFRDFGLPMAVTQGEEMSSVATTALFRVSLKLSLGVSLFVALMAPALAAFYGETRLIAVTLVMALGLLAMGVSIVPEGLMIRRMRFGALSAIDIGAVAGGLAAALTIGALGGGYWALVAQYVLLGVIRSAAACLACGWRPTRDRDDDASTSLRSVLRYGRQLTLTRILQYFGQNTDRILIGYTAGPTTLGLYDNSFRWARYPAIQVFGPLRNVIVSALSRLQEDDARYRRAFRLGALPTYSVVLPALAYMVVDAPHVILAVLGDQWLEAAPLFRFLAASAIATSVRSSTVWSYLSEGRTDRQLRWEMLSAPTLIVAVVVGLRWGVLGVAVAFCAGTWLLVFPGMWFSARGSRIRVSDYLRAWWRPVAAIAVAGLLLFAISPEMAARVPAGAGELDALRAIAWRGPLFLIAYVGAWLALPGGPAAARGVLELVRMLRPPAR